MIAPHRVVLGCLTLAIGTLAPPAHAQGLDSAVFVVRLARDTLAVEQVTIGANRAEGVLRARSPLMRVRQTITMDSAGLVERAVTSVGHGAKGDSGVKQLDVVFFGDSAIARPSDPSSPVPLSPQRLDVSSGTVPFVNLSGLSLELMLRRARAIGSDTARVHLLLGSGTTITAVALRAGADSVVLVVGGVALRARTDAVGRLLGAVVPTQGVIFDRLPGNAPAGAWTPVPTSYAAPAGAPYTARDVVVRTPTGLSLAGTLTMPTHARARVPAVVLITGSGAQDRDESLPVLGDYRPFREIADTLSRRGIAVLRLDDRGIGGSSAGPAAATSADYADDIRAALAWLRTQRDVDPARVGLVGHSEGGLIAPMIAATDPTVRAIALIAAPAVRGRAILAEQQRLLFGSDPALSAAQRDSVLARAARATDSLAALPGWLHFFVDYDPLVAARKVRVPTLILQGETDRQVSAPQATQLANAMRAAGNRRVSVRTFPRMNHLMLDDPSGDPRGYATLRSTRVRRDLLGALADWLARTL